MILLIPGLGADRDLFYPQQEHFGQQLQVVEDAGDAPLWKQTPSMAVAAEAFLRKIVHLIPENDDYVLGGMSFGGSLAVEIARLIFRDGSCRPPAALALIASNRTSNSISRSFRVNRAIGSALPAWLIRSSLRGLSSVFARREGLSAVDHDRLREMAGRADIKQLMWGAKSIANWSCGDNDIDEIEVPIHQIHGRRDWVIPISPQHVTETLEVGRHLITWTHRNEVNAWLHNLVETGVSVPSD